MTGMREIRRLRRELEARDGARFDLKRFHDEVIGHGSLPLATLDPRAAPLGHARHALIGASPARGARALACTSRDCPAEPNASAARDYESKPIPSVSIARRNQERRPSWSSAPITARRMSSTAGVRMGSGGIGNGRERTSSRSSSGESGRSSRSRRMPAAQRLDPTPEAGVPERVVDPPAEGLAEGDREPRRRVDGAAPARA